MFRSRSEEEIQLSDRVDADDDISENLQLVHYDVGQEYVSDFVSSAFQRRFETNPTIYYRLRIMTSPTLNLQILTNLPVL